MTRAIIARALELVTMTLACLTLAWGPLAQGSTFGWGFYGLTLLGLVTLLLASLSFAARGHLTVPNPLWAAAIFAFAAWVWLSVLWSPNTVEAFRWANVWTAILGVVLTIHLLATTPRRQDAVLSTLLVTGGFAVGIALLQQAHHFLPGYTSMSGVPEAFLTGPYFHPSHFSGFLIAMAALCSTVLLSRPLSWVKLPVLALAIGVQVVDFRTDGSSIPAVMLAAVLPILVRLWVKWPKVGVLVTSLSVVAAGATIYVLTTSSGQLFFTQHQRQIGIGQNLTMFVKIRQAVHRFGWEMWLSHPWTGTGVGQWGSEYTRYRLPVGNDPIRIYVDAMFINYAHSDYLQLLAELGIVGLLLFLAILFLNLRKPGTNVWAMTGWASLPAYLFTAVYDGHLTAIPGTILIALLLIGCPLRMWRNRSSVDAQG